METVIMDRNSINNLAKNVLDIEAQSILRLKDNIGEEFDKAIDILYNCKGRVIITGMGKSGLIGRKIAATLTSTGTPSYFLHPAESTHGDSGIITRNDVVIAISNSGETQELLNLLPLIKRFGVTIKLQMQVQLQLLQWEMLWRYVCLKNVGLLRKTF